MNAVSFAVGTCKLGAVLVAITEQGICALWLGDSTERLLADLKREYPDAAFSDSASSALGLVSNYIAEPSVTPNIPLVLEGTEFQRRVWNRLTEIPAGSTLTYSELAESLGMPDGVRAVASACASNRIAVLIPCHRVVRKGGSLAGYRWGVERKLQLLLSEGAELSRSAGLSCYAGLRRSAEQLRLGE